MKTLSAYNQFAVDNPTVDVVRLAKIEFSGLTLYLTDRTWGQGDARNIFNGQIYEPLILSWDTIDLGNIDPVTYETGESKASFVVDNSVPMGGADSFTRLFASYDPHFATVTISEIFSGASAAGDEIPIFKGQVEDVLNMAPDQATITVTGYEQAVNKKFSHEILEKTTFADADPDDVGKMFPQVWGSARKVPFLAISAGPLSTLSENITATDTTVKLSDASLFSATGTILVDSEQITYTGKTGDSLTGCTRGAESTEAVAHGKGADVGEVKTEYVYAIGHPVKAINDVYVDGVKQESDQYTAYTGQTGDEHGVYTGRACISFPSWPQIKKEVSVTGEVAEYNISRKATSTPLGRAKWLNDDGTVAAYDDGTTISFPAAPTGSLSNIYVEYDFELRTFGSTLSGFYEFILDGVLIAEIRDGTLTQFVTSPLTVEKASWTASTTKSKSWRTADNEAVMFCVLEATQYCTSDTSETSIWGKDDSRVASNVPIGHMTGLSAIDGTTALTFPAAPDGSLNGVEITYSWDFEPVGTVLGIGPHHYAIDGINVVHVSSDGTVTELMPSTFTLPKTEWKTSITKSKSLMGEWRRAEALVIREAVQYFYTDSYTSDITISGNSMADSVIGGRVSADVDGWQDDGSGTYTGTPSALIEQPDHIFKHILIDRCGLTASEIDSTRYTAAGTLYAAGSFVLGFMIDEKPDVPAFLNRIAYESKSIQFWEAGVHCIVCIPAAESIDKYLDPNRIDQNQIWPSYTDRAAILNDLSANYNRDWSGYEDDDEAERAVVVATSAPSIAKYGTLKEKTSFPYVTTETHAQAIIDWMKGDLANPRLVIEWAGGYYLTDLERGDVIAFSELLSGGSSMAQATVGLVTMDTDMFRILGMTRRPDYTIQITAVKTD